MRSIKSSIILSFALAIVLASAIAFGSAYFLIRHRVIAQFDEGLRIKAEALASLVELDDGELELDERDEALGEFKSRKNPSYFELRGPDGKTIEKSITLGESLPITLPERTAFASEDIRLPDGRHGRVGMLPIMIDPSDDDPRPARDAEEDVEPTAWVVVALGDADIIETLRDIMLVLAGCVAALAIAMLVAVPKLVTRGLQPLHEMAAWTGRIDADNLAERFPSHTLPAELKPIATQMNASLDRITNAFERERRFAAGAAHELRTPLAAIRTNAEVALRWPDPEAMEAALKGTLTSAERMQSLIERLLELARVGQEKQRPLNRVNVAELIEAALSSIESILTARQLGVDVEVPADWLVRSDEELLRPMIDNLLANAARHATADSTIRIVADVGANRLTIFNANESLVPEDLPHIFEPLWTRSADRGEGAGLGLSLVAEYSRVLKVCVEPGLTPEGDFRQRLTFPT